MPTDIYDDYIYSEWREAGKEDEEMLIEELGESGPKRAEHYSRFALGIWMNFSISGKDEVQT